ncbi:hypothetical protein [Acetobacter pasteurianus]|jgi:hypothetical protein|uniref:hypothetical protein n=1 Tax=Acetobacter pasteurianus TaxID=438 RepID=UPI00130ED00C|nr:hypothetical protein [Acetobacter pasteurianus]
MTADLGAVHVPETPIYLDALLADQPLAGGLEPRLSATVAIWKAAPPLHRSASTE